jgi:hypothetical protein
MAITRSSSKKKQAYRELRKKVVLLLSKAMIFKTQFKNILKRRLNGNPIPHITELSILSRSDIKLLRLLSEIQPLADSFFDTMHNYSFFVMKNFNRNINQEMEEKAILLNTIAMEARWALNTPDDWGSPEWDSGLWLSEEEKKRI